MNLTAELWIYLWIGCYKAERFCDLCRGGTATNIKEISRFTTMQFNNVHCGHRKTRTIH